MDGAPALNPTTALETGSDMLRRVVALARPAEREAAASDIASRLGGRALIVFVRDDEVGMLLPAPGFPQTLPGARAWRAFVAECVRAGDSRAAALPAPDGSGPQPANGIATGDDVVAVVLGTAEPSAGTHELRALLPLLAATLRGERIAELAVARAHVARQSAAHAEALAATLDRTRVHLQHALVVAERARADLEAANERLRQQALEMEAQARALAAQSESLQRASQAKSEFLAVMSHELRTPLNAIGGHTELVALGIHGPVTHAQRDALARIDRNQRHLLGIINDILNLARIESGRVDYHFEAVHLADVLQDLRAMIEPQLRAKGLAYDVRVDGTDVAVRADREKLQQVLLNLLSNAVKFTECGGSVAVHCAGADDAPGRVLVRVIDSGIGIPPDKVERIFEPFVQVDSSHRRLAQGAGLGLAISRDLARGMGGEVAVESAPGRGSTFTLTLPRA